MPSPGWAVSGKDGWLVPMVLPDPFRRMGLVLRHSTETKKMVYSELEVEDKRVFK